MNTRRWGLGFGIGSVFTFIIVLFIYLFSRDRYRATQEWGWRILELITKWYIIITLAIIGIAVLIILIGVILAIITHFRVKRKMSKMKNQDVIDADYKIKE
jgi:MFS family permease